MLIPLSWLKEFVRIDVPVEELAYRLTLAGLEVEEIRYVGLPLPERRVEGHTSKGRRLDTNVTGLGWGADKIVVGEVREVLPHPNADRLVLLRLFDGEREHTVLTGAPNLFDYKGAGSLDPPIKVAYAREGAEIFDGHQPGWVLMVLKRAKIRGVESYSMACSEKELGISEEHGGVILLDSDAPVGESLAAYMGDVVFDISLTPNMARNANIMGVAREVAALTKVPWEEPDFEVTWTGAPIEGRVRLEIQHPELNPRFVLGLVEGVEIGPSPYWIQRRLRLAGMRPINNVVDATNYAMLEVGEPLHAFDFDVLKARAAGEIPTIVTRLPQPGEKLNTLDEVTRSLDDFTVLVADRAGALSIAGVMGGAESEVTGSTTSVLLEGAAWNFINIRRTVSSQKMTSDAAYRFERGVHPSLAERGVRRCLTLMAQLTGGEVAEGLVDAYPAPPEEPTVTITLADAQRWLGIELQAEEMAEILERLAFQVEVRGAEVIVTPPDSRMDIGDGVIGMADLMEEIARLYGYDRIPETQISDTIPPQYRNLRLEQEERVRDQLVALGLQEVVTYRLTSAERERQMLLPETAPDDRPYVQLTNPIASDRVVMRHNLLASVLEVVANNVRHRARIGVFEIGPVYLLPEGAELPEESLHLVLVLTGARREVTWRGGASPIMDFYDLKGVIEALFQALHLMAPRWEVRQYPSFHPGKCARVLLDERQVGVAGELHPLVLAQYDMKAAPVLAADLNLEAIFDAIPDTYKLKPVSPYPAVFEDLAVVVEESIPAEEVEQVLRNAGGELLQDVRLFDLYRGDQIAAGRKSMAYALTYQAPDRTLNDAEIAEVRANLIRALESELRAKLRD